MSITRIVGIQDIIDKLTAIDANTDGIEIQVGSLYVNTDEVESKLDDVISELQSGLEVTIGDPVEIEDDDIIAAINDVESDVEAVGLTLTTIDGRVSNIEGYIDTLEPLVGSILDAMPGSTTRTVKHYNGSGVGTGGTTVNLSPAAVSVFVENTDNNNSAEVSFDGGTTWKTLGRRGGSISVEANISSFDIKATSGTISYEALAISEA